MKKFGLLTIILLVLTLTGFARPSDDIVTSISQVKDVKPADEFYGDLQSLIERYGIRNLTRDYKFNPNGQLESVDYIKLAIQGKDVLKELAVGSGVPESKLQTVWGKNCVTRENMFVMKETVISKWLGCMYGVGDISTEAKDVMMTRGKFAIYLNTALDRGLEKISGLIPPQKDK